MAAIVPIIIPVFNRPELTKQCLDSLVAHTPKDSYQLIVVDDASDNQETIDYIAQYGPIRLDTRSNHGAAVNKGAEVAVDAPYIYFGDNDTYFTEGWLETLLKAIDFPMLGIVGGDRHPLHPCVHTETIDGLTVEYAVSQVGYSMLMRQELWKKIGPFSEDEVGIYGTDDADLCRRCQAEGLHVGAVSPRVVYHCGITRTDGRPAFSADIFKEQGPEGVLKL